MKNSRYSWGLRWGWGLENGFSYLPNLAVCEIPKPKSIPSLHGLGLFLWSRRGGHGIILFSHFSAPRAGRCALPQELPTSSTDMCAVDDPRCSFFIVLTLVVPRGTWLGYANNSVPHSFCYPPVVIVNLNGMQNFWFGAELVFNCELLEGSGKWEVRFILCGKWFL